MTELIIGNIFSGRYQNKYRTRDSYKEQEPPKNKNLKIEAKKSFELEKMRDKKSEMP